MAHSNNLYGGGGGNRTRVRRYRHEDIYRFSLYFKSRLSGPYRHGPDRPARKYFLHITADTLYEVSCLSAPVRNRRKTSTDVAA